jgi:hypothetical protein
MTVSSLRAERGGGCVVNGEAAPSERDGLIQADSQASWDFDRAIMTLASGALAI